MRLRPLLIFAVTGLLALGGMLVLTSLTGASQPADRPLTGVEWRLVGLADGQAPLSTGTVTLTINADNRVFGAASVNRYMGGVTLQGQSLRFDPLATTQMAGPPELMQQEYVYLQAMEQVASYRIDGERLQLLDATGAVLLTFQAS